MSTRQEAALDRIAEIEWQLKLNQGLEAIHRAAGGTNDLSLKRLLYRSHRKDLLEVIYGTQPQERRAA